MLPYELYVRGENPELGKPRATSFSPTTIKKTVRGRGVSDSPKKNAVTNQVRVLFSVALEKGNADLFFVRYMQDL